MSSEVRLKPKARRTILKQLSRDRLGELANRFELDVADRRSIDAHIDSILRKRSLDFRELLGMFRREELQAACEALGLDTSGREKAKFVERILGGPEPEPLDEPEPSSSGPPPASARSEGGLKSALRRFVIDTAGGLRGRDAKAGFIAGLLECFGWAASGPPGAELPATLTVVDNGQRATRDVALFWKERRVLVEVVKHDVMLDFAWKDLLRVCLQVDPVPQYVVLTNQRDLHLYDLARDRGAPRLSIPLDDLPKYSEAFPFISVNWLPGTTPKIINVSKVSGEVAELVAKLYRSLKAQHPTREQDVVQFTLQCILTMFAEDIGLLPQEYFTTLLYDGARGRDVEPRLRELFRLMNTRDLPGPRVVPYFNGGLFTNPVTLPLGDAQLAALTKASEANWRYVDPHIFGSVFQGVMDDAERHAQGAHYTAHEDIMRVVGPTIVEPWRKQIRGAKSLTELIEVRAALLEFRVLDPACGSGNFLYVAFRELYRLDTELLARFREFPSTQGQGKAKVTWGAGIQASNFFGIDINPFAVELAKVTLNIAKKIAFEERREVAADVVGQIELDVDPSLPLDNLDKNIVCADALFTEWPKVDAIVGNPPFLGGLKIRSELGESYLERLQARFPGVNGRADVCAYWFRLAHDRLGIGGRGGLVATNSVREGETKVAATQYIVLNGGTITNAVSSRAWPGEAVVQVSMVNWVKGPAEGPFALIVDDRVYERNAIAAHLQLHADLQTATDLKANDTRLTTVGVQWGTKAFQINAATARELQGDPRARRFIRPIATGTHLLTGRLVANPDYVVDMNDCDDLAAAKKGGRAYEFLRTNVLPHIQQRANEAGTDHYRHWLETWWRHLWARDNFFQRVRAKQRLIACSCHAARSIFVFLSSVFVPNNSMQIFAFDDDYSFGVIQSRYHWAWVEARSTKIKQDMRYTGAVWDSFPWPQEPREDEVAAVASAGREVRRVRDTLMKDNGWSLRALYQAAEIPGPHPLKNAQAALDDAVRAAYGLPADQEAVEFLLELNKLVAEDEAECRTVQGPGVPRGLDPHDPRWTSDDCIQPPSA
jgi:SAM-dependent methyltransferase